jgi:hypothetical protein
MQFHAKSGQRHSFEVYCQDCVLARHLLFPPRNRSLIPLMAELSYDVLYKIVLIGNSGVGKSNLLRKFLFPDSPFVSDSKATIGVDFGSRNLSVGLLNTSWGLSC